MTPDPIKDKIFDLRLRLADAESDKSIFIFGAGFFTLTIIMQILIIRDFSVILIFCLVTCLILLSRAIDKARIIREHLKRYEDLANIGKEEYINKVKSHFGIK